MHEMVQNYLSLLLSLSLPISFCPVLCKDSCVTLMGLVSACLFITAQVGGNKEAIMAHPVLDGAREWGH